jgi:hypothetical protein
MDQCNTDKTTVLLMIFLRYQIFGNIPLEFESSDLGILGSFFENHFSDYLPK